MPPVTSLRYQTLPALTPAYLKALWPRSSALSGRETIPRIEASVDGLRTDPGRLQRYREVCGFADSDWLPISYPHVVAFPLHMRVLTHKAFPLSLAGLIHVRNAIHQQRQLAAGEELRVEVHVEGHREARKGIEFDLVTRVFGETGDLAWEGISTMLSRNRRKGREGEHKHHQVQLPQTGRYTGWQAGADAGRRYAWVAGDINPIHLWPLLARLFGFRRAIAHGMWLVARCAAELREAMPEMPLVYNVTFKQPLLLPGWALMRYDDATPGRVELALLSSDGATSYLNGTIENAS